MNISAFIIFPYILKLRIQIKCSALTKEITNQFLKGYSTFFLEMGSFYHSPRVKQLSLTIFKSIHPIF